jgi:hypothetical protein
VKDLGDEARESGCRESGATAKDGTVDTAPEVVIGRRRVEQWLDDPYAFGVGPDIADPDIMRTARR